MNAINDIELSKGGGLYDIPTKRLKWFKLNRLKPRTAYRLKRNDDKSHLLVSNNISDININIGRYTITCNESVKLLGVRIDNTLQFDEHPILIV